MVAVDIGFDDIASRFAFRLINGLDAGLLRTFYLSIGSKTVDCERQLYYLIALADKSHV